MAIRLFNNVEAEAQIRLSFGDINLTQGILPSRAVLLAKRGGVVNQVPNDAYKTGRNISVQNALEEDRTRGNLTYNDSILYTNGSYVSIADVDYDESSDPKEKPRSITLPFMPPEIEVNPESNFPVVATLGRNLPRYHYTGSEKTITFDISWVAFNELKDDVIKNCTWLESLTQTDGYRKPIHRVMLVWGPEPKLFRNHLYYLVSAPYKLTKFERGYMSSGHYQQTSADYRNGDFIDTKFLPTLATQKVTLKRVSSRNLKTKDILMIEELYNGQ